MLMEAGADITSANDVSQVPLDSPGSQHACIMLYDLGCAGVMKGA